MIKLFKDKIILNKYFILFFLFFIFFVPKASAQVNSGFVSGIWYSQTPFFAGETIRIYSAIQNESDFDIAGKIRFYDGEAIIGESEFSSISGHLIEEWIDWNVSEGEHKIKVKIIDAIKSSPGSQPEPITLLANTSPVDIRYADIDTDNDRVGNKIDDDDDNDGLTDEQEEKLGTNPLLVDSDNDGITDMEKFENEKATPQENEKTKENDANKNKLSETAIKNSGVKVLNTLKNTFNYIDDKVEATAQKIILSLEKKMVDMEDNTQTDDKDNIIKDKSKSKILYTKILSILIWLFNHKWALYTLILISLVIVWKIFRLFRKRQ